MKKVYISGQITGIENYVEKFNTSQIALEMDGYEAVNPCTLPHDHDKSYESYMKEDIKALLECDFIFMLYGWRNSKGARFERHTAMICGIHKL